MCNIIYIYIIFIFRERERSCFFQTAHKNWFSTSTTPEGQDGAEVAPGLWVGSLQFAQDAQQFWDSFKIPWAKKNVKQVVMVVWSCLWMCQSVCCFLLCSWPVLSWWLLPSNLNANRCVFFIMYTVWRVAMSRHPKKQGRIQTRVAWLPCISIAETNMQDYNLRNQSKMYRLKFDSRCYCMPVI